MTIIGLLLLLVLSSLTYHVNVTEVAANGGGSDDAIANFEVSVRGTYLHAESDQGSGGTIDSPAIVDLQANGFVPGDNICISFTGRIWVNAGWGGSPEYFYMTYLIGVFSTSNQLLPIDEVNRVPGAIDAGPDIDTWVTHFYQESTDIPEDFVIEPDTGFWIEVPRNAQFLFICFLDSYYPDNVGSLSVTIEKDTDGDGLPDSWEIYGIDSDKDGTVDLDLPMMGADWEHKDIFVEADYMSGRRPIQGAIDDVKNAFAHSSVSNPDGVNGINLHVIIDENLPAIGVVNSFDEFYILKQFGTPGERSDPKTIEAKKLAFRYCMFVNKIWLHPPNYTCPGVAEGITCDDFILAFGALRNGGTRETQAAVFMHELGHTLGLRHGGDVNVNYKPNYLSIMNYAFEFNAWKPNRPLDYSHGWCIDLDEVNLSESEGIGYPEVTVWTGPDGKLYTNGQASLAINWNNDSVIGARVRVNLNNQSDEPSIATEGLTDYDDWSNLVYRFRGTGLAIRSATLEDYHVELTTEEIEQMYLERDDIIGYVSPESADKDPGWLIIVAIIAVLGAIAALMVFAFVVLPFILKRRSRGVEE